MSFSALLSPCAFFFSPPLSVRHSFHLARLCTCKTDGSRCVSPADCSIFARLKIERTCRICRKLTILRHFGGGTGLSNGKDNSFISILPLWRRNNQPPSVSVFCDVTGPGAFFSFKGGARGRQGNPKRSFYLRAQNCCNVKTQLSVDWLVSGLIDSIPNSSIHSHIGAFGNYML